MKHILIDKAVEAFCSLHCPNHFRSPDEPRHTPECVELRQVLANWQRADEKREEVFQRVVEQRNALLKERKTSAAPPVRLQEDE